MAETLTPLVEPNYDVVGRYRQDDVNGFTGEFLDRMLDLADLASARTVLDAMGGDGNLTLRLLDYCQRRGLKPPQVTLLEYSRVQCEFAAHALAGLPVPVIWGDARTMRCRADDQALPDGAFDRVLIKSANHEIPLAEQAELYRNVHRVLAPGGCFVNLGFLFDDGGERDELRAIARAKDTLAGLQEAAARRHFLTREELYTRLGSAGFVQVRCGLHFDYRIHSETVAREYFARAGSEASLAFQAAQVRALRLRRAGRLRFEEEHTVLAVPGEITLAHRAPDPGATRRRVGVAAWSELERVPSVHTLLAAAARHAPAQGDWLDFGCGAGSMLGFRPMPTIRYVGVETRAEWVENCRTRHAQCPTASFRHEAIDQGGAEAGTAAACFVLNAHNRPGVDGTALLRRAFAALRPGGRLMVITPSVADAQRQAGLVAAVPGLGDVAPVMAEWLQVGPATGSIEGLMALLQSFGPCDVVAAEPEHCAGAACLVVIERRASSTDLPAVEEIFQRSLSAHLPPERWRVLQQTSVLVAGLGGGSNIAELLVRKGFGRLLLADPDSYEAHNIRQRGCLHSTLGRTKTDVMRERLRDINPHVALTEVPAGVTLENVAGLVRNAHFVVDMIDFHGFAEKVALHRECRRQGKFVLTAPSVLNGAVLYVFDPHGLPFERFFDLDEGRPLAELGPRFLRRLIPYFPEDAPAEMYAAAARGERTIPLDAVGVDQAAVLAVAALENLALGRRQRVVVAPRGIHIDASDPSCLGRLIDFSSDFAEPESC